MSTTTVARQTRKYPGCGQPAAPTSGAGRPPEYCAGRGHTRVSAWRERRRLTAEQDGTTISPAEDGNPLTTAKMTGTEPLRSLRAEADPAALETVAAGQLRGIGDPTCGIRTIMSNRTPLTRSVLVREPFGFAGFPGDRERSRRSGRGSGLGSRIGAAPTAPADRRRTCEVSPGGGPE